MKSWKTIRSSLAFDTRWFKVRQDEVEMPNGKRFDDYYVWNNEDVAGIIPITKGKKIILVKQYRQGSGEFTIEIPMGIINKEEKPEIAAVRELQEETGYTGGEVRMLGKFINNASKETGNIYIFAIFGAVDSKETAFDEMEDIETFTATIDEINEMIFEGKIRVSCCLAGLLLLQRRYPDLSL